VQPSVFDTPIVCPLRQAKSTPHGLMRRAKIKSKNKKSIKKEQDP